MPACLIIDDTIDSRRCESYNRARTCGRIHAHTLYASCTKSYQLDERWTSDRKLRVVHFYSRCIPRQRDFFFRRFYSGKHTLIIWGLANQLRWLRLRASLPHFQSSRSISASNKFPSRFYLALIF